MNSKQTIEAKVIDINHHLRGWIAINGRIVLED